MSLGLRRALVGLACALLHAALPAPMRPWAAAVRCEAASIADDTAALLFTLDSLAGLLPRAIAAQFRRCCAAPFRFHPPVPGGSTVMTIVGALLHRPRALGIACAVGAAALGLVYLAWAGAPPRYLGVNAGALVVGLTLLALLGGAAGERHAGGATVAAAGALLATALLGAEVEGAARWVNLGGGLALQPSLVLLPLMLVAFARDRSLAATAGLVVAAAASALQPDRAMAGMLVAGLAALVLVRREPRAVAALVAGLLGLAVTLARADTLPAVAFVDRVLATSFAVHPVAGLAVWEGAALLLVPALAGARAAAGDRALYAVFAAVWGAAIGAAALGHYPTPVVGYGGSAIIGYALSLLALPRRVGAGAGSAARHDGTVAAPPADRVSRVAIA
ncbi:hypothetical protein [Sphingomonas sp. BK235]|uniref:hypothetical protein n=1 Tax=Sphingomonas sp. BK235 TaxID=2512131 RepID=UPI0010D4C9E3|nr:hypothetical protein [Sphingomonas sp. BK235]TCP31867.1 hypothetical protein EV292_10946 [Sphingomonas sp. BK235]